MTILGVGMVVWASVFSFGLSSGLDKTLEIAADPLDVIVMRKGATSESTSGVQEAYTKELRSMDGIATDENGEPLASAELVAFAYLPRIGSDTKVNVAFRGVVPISRKLRTEMEIVEGRDFKEGVREAIVSRAMSRRFQNLALGDEFNFRGAMFKVVGIFEAGGGAVDSDIWTDEKVLAPIVKREGAPSSMQLRAASAADQERMIKRVNADVEKSLNAVTETAYYAEQAQTSGLIKVVGSMVAFFLTIGAMFAVSNTMYGAIASRAREIGTLRALGFGRVSIVFAFLLESLLLCCLGAVLGVLGALAVQYFTGGLQTGTMNPGTFTELAFSFDFGPKVLLKGAILAVVMGLIGGMLPAIRAVRMKVVTALREV